MIKQLAHICIYSQDLDATRTFYTQALGLSLGFEFERDGEPFGYYVKVGNDTFIEVFKGEPGSEGNIKHVAIEVSDLDALIAQIRAAGAEVDDKKLGADHSWQAWATDPNGVRIEFHEYTEQSNQLVGGKCVVSW
jgi:lactoylglutathione lyase/glyoxylase I family protein